MEQLCVEGIGGVVAGIATTIVAVSSALANILPDPKKANGWLKYVSKAVNFAAVNFTVNTKN